MRPLDTCTEAGTKLSHPPSMLKEPVSTSAAQQMISLLHDSKVHTVALNHLTYAMQQTAQTEANCTRTEIANCPNIGTRARNATHRTNRSQLHMK